MNDRTAGRTFNNDEHRVPFEVQRKLNLKKSLCIMFAKRYFKKIGSSITDPREQIAQLKSNHNFDLEFRAFIKAQVEALRTSKELSAEDQELIEMITRLKLNVAPGVINAEMILAKLSIEV